MKIEVRKPTEAEIKDAQTWEDWEKEPSEFPWEYSSQETCYVTDGKATVTPEGGKPISFGAGDLVVFPDGAKCVWKIDKAIKKKFHFN